MRRNEGCISCKIELDAKEPIYLLVEVRTGGWK